MLPKANRLTKKKDFETVFNLGKGTKSDFLIYKMLKNNLSESRFGFVVSKKVSPKATVRNTVKRRLRSAVAKGLETLKSKKPSDVVIIALPSIKEKDFSEIKETINKVIKNV